ncbi:hypothetical protein [Planctomonas psychrotolerans]|uniref:hypothetical protein n=1 Tax=Planctomonas psychrotolerans TaxID=2528712 RepID=UPI00123B3341|nr:hypothetical protein [Planctomonas psychrotolerans]
MKIVLWLVVGIGIGFGAAHVVSRTPQGARFFDRINARAAAVRDAARAGYLERQAELRAVVGAAETTISDLDR